MVYESALHSIAKKLREAPMEDDLDPEDMNFLIAAAEPFMVLDQIDFYGANNAMASLIAEKVLKRVN